MREIWAAGDAYEAYMGRWSTPVAERFVRGLGMPARSRWLDVGCGTGALSAAVLSVADPARLVGMDPSAGFLSLARGRIVDARSAFVVGDAGSLPFADHAFDAVVSGLALNFVLDPSRAVAEFARVAPMVAAYVWDYPGGMGILSHFWDAALSLDPAVDELDEKHRFPWCRPEPLARLWTAAGLADVSVHPIEIPTVFADFDDYWRPFLGGQGPAPGYVMSLPDDHRAALRDLLRSRLPAKPDGSIPLTARAWSVRGVANP
ncbi:Methyltransferase domain-containing protein [Amycolatopsis xylanica]|uniref:Methyltransferase domain-containing protein n=1 Tax=Amycolatopsis xylanica TaxID=589385 RepID=A0A1H3J424_9PSEU|nr:class I SAM-dependent methyltransferase [Amycolatopsis xylanica]SDY34557.1 Methyltransferase domain-containing protein [Amycolatopsis xylanica]